MVVSNGILFFHMLQYVRLSIDSAPIQSVVSHDFNVFTAWFFENMALEHA